VQELWREQEQKGARVQYRNCGRIGNRWGIVFSPGTVEGTGAKSGL